MSVELCLLRSVTACTGPVTRNYVTNIVTALSNITGKRYSWRHTQVNLRFVTVHSAQLCVVWRLPEIVLRLRCLLPYPVAVILSMCVFFSPMLFDYSFVEDIGDVRSTYACKAQWSLYVPPGLTFNSSTFCPYSVCMCFVWVWEQTGIISLYSTNWMVFITETDWVFIYPPRFNIQQFYVLPTQCMYVFCVDLRTNSDYFPIQH